jgi:hypothetical protein
MTSEIERAMEHIPRGLGLPPSTRRRLAEAFVKMCCPCCHGRMPLDERVRRTVNGQLRFFHEACVDRGVLQIRAEAAEARSPQARARLRAAKTELAAIKRRRY